MSFFFLDFFTAKKSYLSGPLTVISQTEMTDFPTLSYTSTSKIPMPEDWERYPFWRAPPQYREYSPRLQERD